MIRCCVCIFGTVGALVLLFVIIMMNFVIILAIGENNFVENFQGLVRYAV